MNHVLSDVGLLLEQVEAPQVLFRVWVPQFNLREGQLIRLREMWIPRRMTLQAGHLLGRVGIMSVMMATMEHSRLTMVVALYLAVVPTYLVAMYFLDQSKTQVTRILKTVAQTVMASITGVIIITMPTAIFFAGSSVSGVWGSIIKALVSVCMVTLVTKSVKKVSEDLHEKANQRAMWNEENGVDESKGIRTAQSITVLATGEEGKDGKLKQQLSSEATVHLQADKESEQQHIINYPSLFLGLSVMNLVTWFLILRQPAVNSREFYIAAVSAILGDLILRSIFSHLTYFSSKRHEAAKITDIVLNTARSFRQTHETAAVFSVIDMAGHIACIIVATATISIFTTAEGPLLPFSATCRQYMDLPVGDLVMRCVFIIAVKTVCDFALIWYEISYLNFTYDKVGEQLRKYLLLSKIAKTGPGLIAVTCCIMVVMRGILPSSLDETIRVCLLGM
ncbi:hypothetical protein HDV05_001021 [Chytridiales sp. JEL 0842]|nr:hypothetical protein HDV05_001021 [Chytridiales sp. JEL 0842]